MQPGAIRNHSTVHPRYRIKLGFHTLQESLFNYNPKAKRWIPYCLFGIFLLGSFTYLCSNLFLRRLAK